jgi:hypothetical protein
MVLSGVVLLLAGVLLGVLLGQMRPSRSALQAAADRTAAAAIPLRPAADDPPATETSHRTVVEDEPGLLPVPPAAPPQQAALALPPAPQGQPAWRKYALSAPDPGGRPIIAVIIDDVGVDKRRSERIIRLPGPLTISFMSYADDLARLSAEAHSYGHELMLHVPMEPMSGGLDPGPGALLESLPRDELKKRIGDDLDRLTGYVGINNHMGSRFTAYAPGMQLVMEELNRRGLLFIDSLTTDHSVGLTLAQQMGVPTAGRNVFLDNSGELAAVEEQLVKLEEVARRRGNAIAIGHPRDATIAALGAWLPTLHDKGLVLVPVTAVVRARTAATAVYKK